MFTDKMADLAAIGILSTRLLHRPNQRPDTRLTGEASYQRLCVIALRRMSSNVSDLMAWDNALIHGKVVSPASVSAMIAPVTSSIPGGGAYGFGLFLRTVDNHPTIWHSGGINGFAAENDVFLDSGLALVVLTNSLTADPDTLTTAIMNSVCTSTQFS